MPHINFNGESHDVTAEEADSIVERVLALSSGEYYAATLIDTESGILSKLFIPAGAALTVHTSDTVPR